MNNVALVNMKDGSVAGHAAGCADLKRNKNIADEPMEIEVASKQEAWFEYNADFIAECDEHEECDTENGQCSNAWDIHWVNCAAHVPSGINEVVANGVKFKGCKCGCGAAIVSKADYRPGHDARHAGEVARAAVEAHRAGLGAVDTEQFYAELASRPALKAKAVRMALGIVAKGESKKSKTAEITEVKVGRWTYPARMTRAGKIERNQKRDGSGAWVAYSKN